MHVRRKWWHRGRVVTVSDSRPVVHLVVVGSSPALVLGVESLGKALNTNFLVLSETDVKFGGPVYLLSAVHVKNPLVVSKIVEE